MKPLTTRPLTWIAEAPIRAEASRRIDADPATVWAAIADHAGWPTWFTQLKSVVPGPTAEGVGGTREVTLGPVTVAEEFLAWEPERRFAFVLTHASRGPVRSMVEDIRLLPTGDGATTVTYVQALDLPGARFIAPVVRAGMSRALAGGLAGLAAHVGG